MNKSKEYQISFRQAELRAKQRREKRILKRIRNTIAFIIILAIPTIAWSTDNLEDGIPTLCNVAAVGDLEPVENNESAVGNEAAVEDLEIAEENKPPAEKESDYISNLSPPETSIGTFKITHYCSCAACCGKNNGITATGTIATADRTIGVDPEVIPYGSQVVIDGQEYVAEDTGNIKGNHIDVFVGTHEEAIARGVLNREVFMINK